MKQFLIPIACCVALGACQPIAYQADDELIVNYDGSSLNELRTSAKAPLVFAEESYANETWASTKLPAGTYHFKINEPVPAVILATALLNDYTKNGPVDFDHRLDPLVQRVDQLHCTSHDSPTGFVGMESGDHVFIIKDYCREQGGGVWEATTNY